ncbi:hypothetical protein [Rhizobium favelukesii]|uniref:hypothetical protein n=1 Tax=Rhizobium favelukesii TaxID=348824 RepID=UPI000404A661|nr:hypothetical protein [Rhizobium favelukesii]MCS0462999.1 hypothetical protein [Rhizobium favelukesii]
MDGWLKGLVATACVVIIAGGAHYGWTQVQASKVREAAKERLQIAKLTREICNQMANATIPEKPGQAPRTTVFLKDLTPAMILAAWMPTRETSSI